MSEAGGSRYLYLSTHAYKYVRATIRLGTASNALVCFANSLNENFAPISQPKPMTPKPITASRELVTRAFPRLDQTSVFDLISDGSI